MIKKIFFLFFSFIFLFMGIRWGLPKKEYIKFFYRNEKELKFLIEGIEKEYIEKSWEISRNKSFKKIERARFNIIRSFHPDEENILKSISNMNPQKFDFNPNFFEYPSFYIYIVALVLKILSLFKLIHITSDISFYFSNPDEIAKFYLTGRLITLMFSILTLSFICNISEKIKKGSSLFTFFLLLFSPIFAVNSIYMTVDIPMIFWIVLALYFLLNYYDNSKNIYLLLSSLSIGLATGTKYPAFIFWFLIPYVLLLKKLNLKEFLKKSFITFLISIFSFFFTTPYSILSFHEFNRDFLYQFAARGVSNFNSLSSIFSNFKEVLNDIILINGYWTSFFFLIMLFFSLFKFKKQLSIFYVGLGLILILLSITSGFKYARYYLPLLIFVVLIVSFSIKEMGNIKKSKILIYIISVFTIGFNFLKTTSCLNLMSSKDTRIISAEYIDKEIKEGNRIVFLKSPWIFEVCPVNFFKYNIIIIENEEELINIPENSYLVIGEFQYFLTKGSRKKIEENIIEKMRNYGFFLVKKFEKKAFFYPNDRTIHDLIYFCPKIFLFYKNERSF